MIAFVMIVLCFIFRNNGIYVVIGTLLSGIILFKWKNKFKFLILLIISTLAFGLYTGPLRNWAGVEKEPNGIREAMSIPCVQLSRVATYNKKVTTEEIKEIKKYIPAYYTYSKNQQGISDIMKNSFNYKLFMKKPGEFALLWGKLGLKYPATYFDAAARLSIGLWYPDMNERDSQAYHPYWEYDPDPNIDHSKWIFVERANPVWTNSIANFYRHLTYQNSYQRYPLVSLLFSCGAAIWVIFIYMTACVYKKKYVWLFPAVLPVFLWITYLLGPVVLFRYVYPIIVTAIIFLVILFSPEWLKSHS